MSERPPDYLSRYRNPKLVQTLAEEIEELGPGRQVTLMHVCGTHENALCQFGLRTLLPEWLRLVAGPGCPVCVCPAAELEMAGRLAQEYDVLLTTFGDVMRVPVNHRNLIDLRGEGADCQLVYSIADAVALARAKPERQVVFYAVGFETTACTTAAALIRGVPDNFSVLCSHRLVPPALEALLDREELALDGFLLPGHVSTVIGVDGYQLAERFQQAPMVVTGFEPVDMLVAIKRILEMLKGEQGGIVNDYQRAVRSEGNLEARRMIAEALDVSDAAWRGIGVIEASGLVPAAVFEKHDAARRFGITPDPAIRETEPGCLCGAVLLGIQEPEECPLFGKACDPGRPLGPCMVAFEGTCHARFRYAGIKQRRSR